jgi:pimeloyl-ACP methyl ester carboxylesterase
MPLSDSVAADLGANLYYHRPAGHVVRERTMAGVRVGDWLSDAREALAIGALLGDRVVLIGMSNGGALATWASIRHPEALDALVLLSPNFGPLDPAAGLLTAPGGRFLARMAMGPVHTWQPENAAQAEAWDTAYPSAALVPMMRLSTWVDQRRRLRAIEAPTLVVYSPEDQVVDPREILQAAAWVGGSPTRLVPIEGVEAESGHVLAGDAVSPGTTEQVRATITGFLRDVMAGR